MVQEASILAKLHNDWFETCLRTTRQPEQLPETLGNLCIYGTRLDIN